MKIENYINTLLYRYQCVTIPNFGAFVTEIVSAQINNAGTFEPPRKLVTFNANIKNSDGLLTNHIAVSENTSYEKALLLLENQVQKWRAELLENKTLNFANVGTLSVNDDESSWSFTPSLQTNYLSSSFGLAQLSSPVIQREVLKEKEEISTETPPIIIPPEHKTRKLGFLKYAAAFTVLATAGIWGYKYYNDTKAEKQTFIVQKNVQDQVTQKIQQATFFIETPNLSVALPVAKEQLPFHIVAGAFRSNANAKKALNMLLEQGYKAQILPKNKHQLFPVTYGSYQTKEEAEKAQQKLRNEGNNDAWLLIE